MSGETYLYEQVVDVTHEYLGPAADRFISRQIRNHLQKSPEELTTADLHKLIDWIKLSMAFLTSDQALVRQYINSLRALAPSSKKLVHNAGSNAALER